MDALSTELKTYQAKLPNLLGHQGKFVLIHGEEIVGLFDSYADAMTVGYEKIGLKPFLVRKITPVEQALFFTRDIGAACPV